jgi:CheY-like chemotaxis protein
MNRVEHLPSSFLEVTLFRNLAKQDTCLFHRSAKRHLSPDANEDKKNTSLKTALRAEPQKGGFMSKEILIVEDEPGVVAAIRFLMEQQGYRVKVAEKGEDALRLILKNEPHLVLLDVMLPGMSGWEVCEQIRLNPGYRRVKIAFLTARSDEAEVARGLALGADAYIIKPFSNDKLIAKVKSLLEETGDETNK